MTAIPSFAAANVSSAPPPSLCLISTKSRTASYRVLYVLDHALPLLTGYSMRSHSLLSAQRKNGFAPEVVTGPLHELDDLEAGDTPIDAVLYRRTPLRGPVARRAIKWNLALLRESDVRSYPGAGKRGLATEAASS
jgi:hypothetical protein